MSNRPIPEIPAALARSPAAPSAISMAAAAAPVDENAQAVRTLVGMGFDRVRAECTVAVFGADITVRR